MEPNREPIEAMTDKPHILLVEARFYEAIADELTAGALGALEAAGCTFDRIAVPGALEIPAAIGFAVRAMQTGKAGRGWDGFVALGCVIRGETTHYDYVCQESAHGLQELALAHGIAVANGILTVENEAQAWARARVAEKNKGGFAARACLDMIGLKRHFGLCP